MRIIFEYGYYTDPEPQSDPQMMHVVIARGYELIAYTAIISIIIDHQGVAYQCCGLSGVLTFPAYRRQGYGSQLIGAATNLIREDTAVDIGLLWTATHNVHLYAQHGWETMPDMLTFEGDPADPTPHNNEERLMLFLSQKGKAGRAAFEHGRVYVGSESW